MVITPTGLVDLDRSCASACADRLNGCSCHPAFGEQSRVVRRPDRTRDVRSAMTVNNPVGCFPGGHVTPAATNAASSSTKRRKPRRRVYVLDTSVLLADPSAMSRFAEHDVVLPIVVITELEAK